MGLSPPVLSPRWALDSAWKGQLLSCGTGDGAPRGSEGGAEPSTLHPPWAWPSPDQRAWSLLVPMALARALPSSLCPRGPPSAASTLAARQRAWHTAGLQRLWTLNESLSCTRPGARVLAGGVCCAGWQRPGWAGIGSSPLALAVAGTRTQGLVPRGPSGSNPSPRACLGPSPPTHPGQHLSSGPPSVHTPAIRPDRHKVASPSADTDLKSWRAHG